MKLLRVAEVAVVVAFFGVAGWALRPKDSLLPALDAAALAVGPAEEQWMGLFLNGQHVGYAVSTEAAAADGGRVFSQRSAFKLAAMGEVQQIVAAGTALTDAAGRVRRFDFLLSAPTRISGSGVYRDGAIELDVNQSGDATHLRFEVAEPPVIGQTLGATVRGKSLTPGMRFEVPYFDPITRTNAPAVVTVEAPEVLPSGEPGWWLRSRQAGFETRRLVDAEGRVLREEGAMGLSAVRMTQAEATNVADADPPDLVALAAVTPKGPAPSGARVVMRLSGVTPEQVPNEPPLQRAEGTEVTVSVPLLAELRHDLPVASARLQDSERETEPTLSLPSDHPEIVARAKEVVGDASDRLTAARRLYDFVYSYVQKVPTIGLPNGLDVLRSGRGDCNEHTALYVSLARAAGIPSRIGAGLVYSERMGEAFYYHAWPEVRLGPDGPDGLPGWVPLDPTLGQFPADGSHLKLVTGDLDRQVEIMGVMGRIGIEVVTGNTP